MASPTRTAAAVMMDLLSKCFKKDFHTEAWQSKLKEMAPSFGHSLSKDPAAVTASRARTAKSLGLNAQLD